MKDLVYRFLDDYCKEEIICIRDEVSNQYRLVSGDIIVLRIIKLYNGKENVILYRSDRVCDAVQEMFSLTKDESTHYVRDWIGDKLGLKKVRDLLKLLPNEKF